MLTQWFCSASVGSAPYFKQVSTSSCVLVVGFRKMPRVMKSSVEVCLLPTTVTSRRKFSDQFWSGSQPRMNPNQFWATWGYGYLGDFFWTSNIGIISEAIYRDSLSTSQHKWNVKRVLSTAYVGHFVDRWCRMIGLMMMIETSRRFKSQCHTLSCPKHSTWWVCFCRSTKIMRYAYSEILSFKIFKSIQILECSILL